MRKAFIASSVIVLVAIVAGIVAYQHIPGEVIASHWDAAGNVNGHMSKFWGVFLMPLVMVGVLLLFWLIPRIDPLRENIASFRPYYEVFVVLLMGFFLYVHALTLLANLGGSFNLSLFVLPGIGALFFFIGLLMPRMKRNFFMGIRNPWTLSDDVVWRRSHVLGGRLFMASGVLAVIGTFLPARYVVWALIGPVLVSAGVVTVYSYVLFSRREKKKGKKRK